MELRQLEHFVTTADFGSTRRAAETLYTSQSSVSKNISMLEEELGVTLFVRSNRGVSLTEAGREFYDQAHTILQNVRLRECPAYTLLYQFSPKDTGQSKVK